MMKKATPASWKPGQSGNPKGRPKGSRDAINETFLEEALEAWHKHGKKALDEMATNKPADFVRMYAGLMPREKNVTRRIIKSVRDLTDEELKYLILEETARPGSRAAKSGPIH